MYQDSIITPRHGRPNTKVVGFEHEAYRDSNEIDKQSRHEEQSMISVLKSQREKARQNILELCHKYTVLKLDEQPYDINMQIGKIRQSQL